MGAEHAGRVGLVEVEDAVVAPGEVEQTGQVGAVAVHAEHGLGHDQARAALVVDRLQLALEVVEVVVAEADLAHARLGQARVQARVVEPVGEHLHRPGHQVDQGRQDRGVGLVARGEQQGRVGALEGGQAFLDQQVLGQGSRDQARGRGRAAEALRVVGRAGAHEGMQSEAQVVVGRDVDEHPTVRQTHAAASQAADRAHDATAALGLGVVEGAGQKVQELGPGAVHAAATSRMAAVRRDRSASPTTSGGVR